MAKPSAVKIVVLLAALVLLVFVVARSSRINDRRAYDAEVEKRLQNKIRLLGITGDDHVSGPRDADVFLIEYADVNCPFCRNLHPKLKQLVEEKKEGVRVAWMYRHFPLAVSAGKVDPEERALECAGREGGDPTFFSYLERLVAGATERENFTNEHLVYLAQKEGLNSSTFSACLISGIFDARVRRDHHVGALLGVSVVPHVFFLTRGGVLEQIVGNKPLSVYKGIVNLLQQAHP